MYGSLYKINIINLSNKSNKIKLQGITNNSNNYQASPLNSNYKLQFHKISCMFALHVHDVLLLRTNRIKILPKCYLSHVFSFNMKNNMTFIILIMQYC